MEDPNLWEMISLRYTLVCFIDYRSLQLASLTIISLITDTAYYKSFRFSHYNSSFYSQLFSSLILPYKQKCTTVQSHLISNNLLKPNLSNFLSVTKVIWMPETFMNIFRVCLSQDLHISTIFFSHFSIYLFTHFYKGFFI